MSGLREVIREERDLGADERRDLELRKLAEGLPAITPAFGASLAEAGAVCLEDQGHCPGVEMKVFGEFEAAYGVSWPEVTEQMRRCWNDEQVATEHGAYGVAIMLVVDLTGYTVVERSRKTTGFDYWLGHDGELPFQNKARLEVSGKRKGTIATVKQRTRQKTRQMDRSNRELPGYAVVVEFGRPLAQVEAK